MSIDKVQLKQEERVGNQTVLTDINPVTSTTSVLDPDTGSTMQEVLDRIYNMINNKLVRVVNSVNNRTGVVVLNADDVGLGNVDNVSFQDIKEWVLEQLRNLFQNKHLRLYNIMSEATIDMSTNDKTLDGTPFFSETVDLVDKRACIGYFYWDNVSGTLNMDYRYIKTFGSSDGSIRYDDTNGKMTVNIHPDEEALSNVDSGDINTSGLKIDPTKIVPKMIHVDSMYGTGTQAINSDDPTSLLATIASKKSNEVEIYIDDVKLTTPQYLNTAWATPLRIGDTISTNFKERIDSSGKLPGGDNTIATFDLMCQQPAYGIVTAVPDDVNLKYTIKFYIIRPYIGPNPENGFGLTYYTLHDGDDHDSGQLGVRVTDGTCRYGVPTETENGNYSGLQIFSTIIPKIDPDTGIIMHQPYENVETPWGKVKAENGISIITNATLCTYPYNMCGPYGDQFLVTDGNITTSHYFGSKIAKNWYLPTNGYIPGNSTDTQASYGPDKGYGGTKTRLSIKLNKIMTPLHVNQEWYSGPYTFYNVSGMRISSNFMMTPGKISETLPFSALGITDGKDAIGNPINQNDFAPADGRNYENSFESGGCMVNVGKFLEICPVLTDTYEDYYDGGKVQVRIGNGLKPELEYELVTVAPESGTWEKTYQNYVIILPGGTTPLPIELIYTPFNTEPDPEVWEKTYFNYYTYSEPEPGVDVYTKVPRVLDGSSIPTWQVSTYYEAIPEDPQQYIDDGELYYVHDHNRIAIDYDKLIMDYTPDETYVEKQLLYDRTDEKIYLTIVPIFTATSIIQDITLGNIIDISGGSEIATALTTLAGRVDDLERRVTAIESPSEP